MLLDPEAKKVEVGHDLDSCTASVEAIPFCIDGFHGSIIDTPGFDDTYLTDTAVLRRISDWMDMTYVSAFETSSASILVPDTQTEQQQ